MSRVRNPSLNYVTLHPLTHQLLWQPNTVRTSSLRHLLAEKIAISKDNRVPRFHRRGIRQEDGQVQLRVYEGSVVSTFALGLTLEIRETKCS